MRKWAIIIISVVIVALIIFGLYVFILRNKNVSVSNSETVRKGPIEVTIVETRPGVIGLYHEYTEVEGEKYYQVLYVKEGLEGYLIKAKVSNRGSTTCTVAFALITSTGRQLGLLSDSGTVFSAYSPALGYSSPEKEVIVNGINIPSGDEFEYAIGGAIPSLAPGASQIVPLLYGLQPGEEPAKLHVIARCLDGNTYEFDVPISS